MLFHKKLGSYRDKAERIEKLAAWIATDAFGRPDIAAHAATAARLAKTDLTSDMVFEFPELQGTMGGIYAREEGQPEQVWKAIYHQYLPIGVEVDAPPTQAQLGDGGGDVGGRLARRQAGHGRGLDATPERSRPGRAIPSGCGVRCTASSGS